ncbi:TonB-dependent receptor [Terricaulis silvestris]|uniref:Pesticin receptor n=1 Tax=Terricaulis silvestris TaxID=2686094 RepID=A0A6I6MGI3_9CAUL|nr:TonB-dependent receptor [Terricaulis silvestris]QGZ93785.1 Pesticin receptor [Terricaulis silvestris]
MRNGVRFCAPGALLATTALFTVCGAPTALAQETPTETTTTEGDIVVTAQRRNERLQDVPIAVTALNAEQIESQGLLSTHDLAQAVTGLTITESGAYVQPFIRGVGSTVTNLGEQGSTATYVDGVYMPAVHGQWYDMANVESIQVLKGPQGTLFGRNANTGAIIITTRAPQHEFEGAADVSYGNYNSFGFRGFLTGPISETTAWSLSANFDSHDGWIRNLFRDGETIGGGQRYAVRGNLLIEPTPNVDILLSADTMRQQDPTPILIQPINGYQGYVPGDPGIAGLTPEGPYDFIGNENVDFISEQDGISARVIWDIDSVTLQSITAFRTYGSRSIEYDSDTTPFRYSAINSTDEGDNFTQEFQLNSNGTGPLNWVVGAFYMKQNANYDPLLIRSGVVNTFITAQQVTEASALFADGTYDWGTFELTLGLRYSTEDKSYDGQRNGVQLVTDASASWEATTPRVVLAYHPNDDFLLYASYSQGFKSGSFNANGLSTLRVNPETVDAYEIGLKMNPMPGFTFNTSIFSYQAIDMQVQALDPNTNLIRITNAAEMESYGADIEIGWRPIDPLSLRLGVSYLHTEFTDFPNAQIFVPNPGFTDGRNMPILADVTGNENVRSPEFTINLAADYTFDLASGGSVVPSFNIYHSSSFFWEVGNRIEEPAYTLINAQVTWNLPGDQVALSAWGRNLTDEVHFRNVAAAAQADRQAADEPMMYGVSAGFRF